MQNFGIGKGHFSSSSPLTLHNILLIPSLSHSILSADQLIGKHYFGCFIQNRATKKLIGKGHRSGRLFALDLTPQHKSFLGSFESFENNDLSLCNRKLGHPKVNIHVEFWFVWKQKFTAS